MQTHASLPLTSLSIRLLAVAALLGSSVAAARADTVASFTGGTLFNNTDFYLGQSFTTQTTTPENNVAFSFFIYNGPPSSGLSKGPSTKTPFATGTGFLLSQAYTGTPAGLSPSTPGFLGQATASGGYYGFAASLTLLPGTQYFFYETGLIPANSISGGGVYAGGIDYVSYSSTSSFGSDAPFSANFLVTGSAAAVSVPDGGTTVVLLGLGLAGLALTQRVVTRRAHAG